MENKPTPKPWIKDIHAYVPGKSAADDGTRLIKLSANENPLGCSPNALEARAAIGGPAEYPDPDSAALRKALGKLHNIDSARIVCGTGSDELLNLAAQAFAGEGDEVAFSQYSFSVYDIAARRCGATPVEAQHKDYGTDIDGLLACVTDKTRVVFLANPNNPTGTYLPKDELARLHASLPANVLLVVDRAYAEYVDPANDDGALALAATHENVLVTHTFSKIYGLAGERIGWATGAPDLVDMLDRIRGPFNVTQSGQAAARAALDDQKFVADSRLHNSRVRADFAAKLEALGNYGLRIIPSETNFLLVLFDGTLTAERAHSRLAEIGYAVRWLPGQGLPQALRITIGTEEQMNEIATALRHMAERAQ